MSPLTALSSAWRQWRPRVDPRAGSRALVAALRSGASLAEALRRAAPMLAKVAVSEAAGRFEGGALALFIVDVRDSLCRQVLEAGAGVHDGLLHAALRTVASNVEGETFVQHLINTTLEASAVYVESMPVEVIDEGRCTQALTVLMHRSLCALISRTDGARCMGERSHRVEFIPFPVLGALVGKQRR